MEEKDKKEMEEFIRQCQKLEILLENLFGNSIYDPLIWLTSCSILISKISLGIKTPPELLKKMLDEIISKYEKNYQELVIKEDN